jgi:hypothetical protein
VLAFTLALCAPLAIPVTASASTFPSGNYFSSPQENDFVNDVWASSPAQGNPAFKVKFELGDGISPTIGAIEDTYATAQCSGCTAIAIGFQVVTTTLNYFDTQINLKNDAIATTGPCRLDCTAVADGYQVVVATNTPQAMNFGQLLSPGQLIELYNIRSQVLALPYAGLTVAQIQSTCQNLVSQVESILQDASYGNFMSYSLAMYSPAFHGAGLLPSPTSYGQTLVKLYKSIQVLPASAG